MLRVVAYMRVIPPGNKNPQKPLIIKNFIEGVNRAGDQGLVINSWQIVNADVSVIQGFVHKDSKQTRHLLLRKNVYENQIKLKKKCLIVDSSLFLWADPKQEKTYLRYGFNGIFPNTAEYCNETPDPARWEKIKKDLNVDLKPWRINKNAGDWILICCQRDGGWSMDGTPVMQWLTDVIRKIRKYSGRRIKVRFHPGDKNTGQHHQQIRKWITTNSKDYSNVGISTSKDIRDEYAGACAVVGHNSSPTVSSVIEGIPTFVTDPLRAQSSPVAHHSFEFIEKPKEFDRTVWVQRMAQIHWTLNELRDGTAWRHLRKWVK
tara:strand:- start:7561 stop:8514 length:954 start_codon:yes stop_codon:yes gene_type:complete